MANGRKRTAKARKRITPSPQGKRKSKKSTANSGIDYRHQNKGKVENLKPFKSRKDNGGVVDSRINLSGRPKLLGEAHRKVLAAKYPDELIVLSGLLQAQIRTYAPNEPITYADAIALDVAKRAAMGDVSAAREMRSATEGERLNVRTWRDDIVDMLKARQITPEQVREDFGDDADSLIAAAGLLGSGE